MTNTNTDEAFIAVARDIADEIMTYGWEHLDVDAFEQFDRAEWSGYHVRSSVTHFDFEKPSMYSPGVVGAEGTIVVTDPEGGVIELQVSCNRYGDIEIN